MGDILEGLLTLTAIQHARMFLSPRLFDHSRSCFPPAFFLRCLLESKLMEVPKHLRVDPFPNPISHFRNLLYYLGV